MPLEVIAGLDIHVAGQHFDPGVATGINTDLTDEICLGG